MASLDRYRPPREGYQPPSLPPRPPPPQDRHSKSPSRRRNVPPAAPSPPTLSSRTSPPRPHSRRSDPSPAQHAIPISPVRPVANQWFFTDDEVVSTPSVIDGLSPAEETIRRAKGVNFIYQVGICLQPHPLPQVTLYVAAVFFHRFFMRYSMVEEKGGIHHYNIAATAIFLANKTEENCFKTKNLIIAVAKVAQKNKDLIIDEQSKEYWRWRDSILMYEELMLETLTFDLMVANPYEQLWNQLHKLELIHEKNLRASAWSFCNDTAMTTLPLVLTANDIAMAAIFFASIATNTKIEDIGPEPWWRFLNGNEERIVKAIEVMTASYNDHPLRKTESALQGSPEFILENTRRRGDAMAMVSQTEAGSSHGGTPRELDRATASPNGKVNGRLEAEGEESERINAAHPDAESDNVTAESQASKGDSDAALKAAANDLDHHRGKPNGGALLSPGAKRKSAESELGSDGEPDQKRPRQLGASS